MLFLKKNFKPLSISKQKSSVYYFNFPEGFDMTFIPFWLKPGKSLILAVNSNYEFSDLDFDGA